MRDNRDHRRVFRFKGEEITAALMREPGEQKPSFDLSDPAKDKVNQKIESQVCDNGGVSR